MSATAFERPVDPLDAAGRSISDMELAAADAGIERDGALGIWVRTSARTLETMVSLVREQRESIERTAAERRGVLEAELEQAREFTARADLELRKMQAGVAANEIEKERVIGAMVKTIAPDLTKALRETVVLKEWRLNKRLNALHYAKVVSAFLLVLAAGYSLRTYEKWSESGAVARCLASIEANAAGRRYCPVDVLVADARPAAAATAGSRAR